MIGTSTVSLKTGDFCFAVFSRDNGDDVTGRLEDDFGSNTYDWNGTIYIEGLYSVMGLYSDSMGSINFLVGLYSVNYCSSLMFNGIQWDL